ncbi:Peroxide stress regulator; Ferric uptake regulation protein; Fe2+/Zn2+ uptake regulation proteins [hydrothermal vent metagenome]|uniref:Peroxide stress regulator Ferric uptake regulation protein Fe2+/Zn2+ uptake regulation proteins n=1 Tax=hydrothermal vent metagenome TaxID=652676 RepID=A0A1W1BUC2_9ZZZZ
MTDYISMLKNSDLKATIQRTSILKSIHKAGHINIDEIYEDVKELYPTLSLATIYKNIILMQTNNIIVEVPMNGAKSKYELKKEEHIHLICQKCGTIQDTKITKKTQEALIIENFKLNHSQINLYGLCQTCQSK